MGGCTREGRRRLATGDSNDNADMDVGMVVGMGVGMGMDVDMDTSRCDFIGDLSDFPSD